MADKEDSSKVSFEADWKRRFQRFASSYDDDAGIAGWTTTGLATRLRQFRRLWGGAAPGAIWLDAGSGAGTYTRFLAERGLTVLGLDYSWLSVSKARSRDEGQSLWVVGDVTRLPLQSAAFDGVLCFGVTQALSGSDKVVGELARVVRPGGQVWIDGLNGWCLPHLIKKSWYRLRGKSPRLRYETSRSLQRAMTHYGFVDVRRYWLPVVPGWLRWLQQMLESHIMRRVMHQLPLVGALISHSLIVTGRVPDAS